MNKLKLLIVDDEEDNRLVLRAICKKLEGFEIEEAVDGIDAIEKVESWRPHIVLMDIMMPQMDGYEASKIIKEKYPQTVIIAVTAIFDSRVQDNMSEIGVDIYIHKPVDRGLIRYKLQSLGSALQLKLGSTQTLSKKSALNPFNSDIRSFKTIFDITDTEAMMDFGIWLFDKYCAKPLNIVNRYDRALEIFYKLMTHAKKNKEEISLIIEESHEEFYINLIFETAAHVNSKHSNMIQEFGEDFIINDTVISLRLKKPQDLFPIEQNQISIQETKRTQETPKIEQQEEAMQEDDESVKEIRVINSDEKELLHQSFVDKTSATDYINDIGGDVLEEILDLASIDEEWMAQLVVIEQEKSQASLVAFTDTVLNAYISAINNLFEFKALAYALSSLSVFINDHAEAISEDEGKIKTLMMLLELLGEDLRSWKEHIFVTQSTGDIHYLDSSFFSSCMQIESIISEKELSTDDDNDIEFF